MFKLAALVIVVALLNLLGSAHANIIGIDFASDSIKVAIVQPGTPLEIGKQTTHDDVPSRRCNDPLVVLQ
jgi:hypothetical protein